MYVGTDSKIYQVGTISDDDGNHIAFRLMKYYANGITDSFFGNNGKVITSVLKGNNYAESILIDNTSKIIIAGYSQNDSDLDFTLAGYNNGDILPVSLFSFTAQKQNNTSLVQWQTTNEINNDYFNIERSPDSRIFTTIVKVGALNGSNKNNYTFIDNNPLQGINYYRLKQVDKDGKFVYSKIVSVEFDNNFFAVSPNPADNQINISIPKINSVSQLVIYDVAGKKVMNEQIAANTSTKQINIQKLSTGIYNFALIQNGKQQILKFIKK